MYHVLQTSVRAVSIALPLVFLCALGVFLISGFDLATSKLASNYAIIREFAPTHTVMAEPLYMLIGSAAVMFLLALLAENNKG